MNSTRSGKSNGSATATNATGENYPTLHPAGHIEHINVNGYAGAIELYLGTDALTAADGSIEPVQWTGYEEQVHASPGSGDEQEGHPEAVPKQGVHRGR